MQHIGRSENLTIETDIMGGARTKEEASYRSYSRSTLGLVLLERSLYTSSLLATLLTTTFIFIYTASEQCRITVVRPSPAITHLEA